MQLKMGCKLQFNWRKAGMKSQS